LSKQIHQTFATVLRRPLQTGFTLLEILVVIGLLSILALGMAAMLEDDGHWRRDEVTEERWQRIRKSIIGDPNLTLNGSPQVAGYLADMGRLPFYISELTTQDPTFDLDNDGDLDDPCLFGANPVQQPDYDDIAISGFVPNVASGFVNTVSGGWRGPYLHTEGSRFFGDGWFGFRDSETTFNPKDTQNCNFAWNVIATDNSVAPPVPPANLDDTTDLVVRSFGNDRVAGGTASAQDYPAAGINMINLNEWKLSAAPITFNIQFNRAVTDVDIPRDNLGLPVDPITNPQNQLQLVVYKYIDNGNNIADAADLQLERSLSTFTLSSGLMIAPAQNINLDGMPIGRYAAVIWCTDNDNFPTPPTLPDYTNDVVYDGTCKANNTLAINHSPVYFTLMQSTSQVTIVWNLP
jgi:prepilin-type N-terminal cleavage/methylation domain-containing protein